MSINLDGILGVSATGNITGNYIFGNGSQLTGIVTSNVDLGNISQNVIPSSNVTYSLGNATNQWKDLWVSNNTIYLNSIPISLNSNNDLLVNSVPVVLSSNTAPPQTANIATTATVIGGNVVISNTTPGGGITFPDGTTQTTAAGSSNYGDSNVSTYLASGVNTDGVDTTGNVTANFFIGDGSLLTGLPASYGNANVEAYLPTYSGNIANLNVTGNLTATTLANNTNTTQVATTEFVQNVVSAAGGYGDAQVETLLASGNITGNIETTGNIIGAYLYGDGSNITGLPASYGNANVEAYLPTSNIIIGINSNIANTDSNVANLTLTVANLATTSDLANTNANVANLTTDLGNTNSNVANLVTITTNTDSNVANLTISLANTDSNVANLTTALSNTNSNVANLTIATGNNTNSIAQLNIAVAEGVTAVANTNANVANTNSNVANLQSQVNALPVINTIPSVYLTAVANGNGQSFSNVILGSYTSNTSMTVFFNGALLENTNYTLAGDVLTINTYLTTGDAIDVITTLASNVNNVTSGYGNSNVAAYFADYAGNIVPATDNAYYLGQPGNVWATIYATDVSVANTVTSTLFVGNGMTIDGNVFIAGNANIQGNLTYTNITNLTTDNLVLGLGNNQTGINVTGGGIAVGNTNEATLLYNFTTQTWDSNLGIDAAGNITAPYFIGDGSLLTGLPASYSNANVAAYLPTYTGDLTANNATFTGTVTANGNTNGTAFAVVGNGAVSNVALGFFPTGNAAAEMAIRDYSTVTSTMYFDTSIGGTANGSFQFRTSNAYTLLASVSNTGLTVNSTQTSNTDINSTVYYNTSTSQYTAGPSMAAFAGVMAPFSGNVTSNNTGHWIQASDNIVLPQYTTVPIGTMFTITNSAGGGSAPIRVSVFNQAADFLYFPPQYNNTTRYIDLFFGQWITVISRGTGEWDIIASNIQSTQKISEYVNSTAAVSLDTLSVRLSGQRLQFSLNATASTCYGQTLQLLSGSGPGAYTIPNASYSVGTWTDLMGANFGIQGDTAESYLAIISGSFIRNYRITGQRLSSATEALINIERMVG